MSVNDDLLIQEELSDERQAELQKHHHSHHHHSHPAHSAHITPALLQQLREEENLRQTNFNLIICCITLFCAEASRGLFIPSLWSCVQHIGMDHSFLSWCIPIFSVGRMFGSYAAGRASDHWGDDGFPTVCCIVASMVGGSIYVMADMRQSWMLLLVAEFGMGIGGGTLAVLRAHISKITTDKMRMSHTTYISTAQFAGLGLMPLVALAINYAFIGKAPLTDPSTSHVDEMMLATATGVLGDAVANAMYNSFPSKPVTPSSTRTFHAGLENWNPRSHRSTSIHASKRPSVPLSHRTHEVHGTARTAWKGRHLLEATTDTTMAVAPLVASSASSGVVVAAAATAAPPTFLQQFINHRTAPAHLLIALNLGCLLLYFLYFDSQHTSFEYRHKKAADASKKAIAESVKKAREEGNFDVDNEAGGSKGAFSQNNEEKNANASTGKNKKVKELIFDLSKLDALMPSTAQADEEDEAGSKATEADAADSSDSSNLLNANNNVSVVQVRDTTVITLNVAPSSSPPPSSSSSSSSSLTDSHHITSRKKQHDSSSSLDPDDSSDSVSLKVRDSSSVSLNGSSSPPSSGIFSVLRTWFAAVVGVTHAIAQLFHSEHPTNKNKGNKATADSSASSSAPSSASSQSSRISSYESGSSAHDLDHEGIYLGALHLTPDRMILWGSCLFVYLNFVIRGVLATVETVGTPMIAHFQGIPPGPREVEASAIFFGVLGLLGCIVFFFQWYFQDHIDEPTSLIIGFVVTVVGSTSILLFSSSERWFIFGCFCIWSIGLPAVQNSVLAALSRILGTRPQGTWMGWIQTFGSLGRVTFPLLIKVSSVSFAFFMSSMGCGIAIVALIVYMKLVKMTM